MRSLGGFILLAGIGVGLFVYLPTPVDNNTSLKHATRVSEQAVHAAPAPSRLVAFSPAVPLPTAAVRQRNTAIPKPTLAVVRPGDLPVTTSRQGGLNGWQTVVATTAGGPIEAVPASLQPTDANSRYELIVELQKNLKRLGCYWGRIDGSWGPGSKDAMRTFTDRVNAALPTDQPDYVLLTLLQGHSGKTCGAEATIAQRSSGSSEVASASAEPLPWKAAGQPVFKPVANSVISTTPLPGRMAIGAPKALPPVDQTYNAASPYSAPRQSPNVATAALEPDAHSAPAAEPSATRKRTSSNSKPRRSRRRDGPGTPRYNLMLSLGGVY